MENARINGYVLKYKLGDGGMAEIWYAQNALQKPAAIKILRKKFCDEIELVARFENEARLMVQLNHPNIRNIQDYGLIDGHPCMVMEYLEGKDLAKRMKDGEQFTTEQLRQWWNDLVDVLQYTHRKHIIHRDIKPSNLFVTEYGKIKLLDFGVAKIKDSITVTQTGSRMGTLMYMSPEQVYDVKNLTHKTDVYSLAVTFYHLVTGKPPYDSSQISDFEIQENIVRKPIDISVLPQAWWELLNGYFPKSAEERKELHKIEENISDFSDETIYINPVVLPVQHQYQPAPPSAAKVYRPERAKKRSSPFYVLFPVLVVMGLIAFTLNSDKIATYFKSNDKPYHKEAVKKTQANPLIIKKEKASNNVLVSPADTVVINDDTEVVDDIVIEADKERKESEVKSFINDYYRGRSNCSNLSRYFNKVVAQYYNKSNVSLATIEKECESYHGKWKFTDADIKDESYVFTHNQNNNTYVDFTMMYYIKQLDADPWIPYKIDVSMVIDENNKIDRIVERRIEKL